MLFLDWWSNYPSSSLTPSTAWLLKHCDVSPQLTHWPPHCALCCWDNKRNHTHITTWAVTGLPRDAVAVTPWWYLLEEVHGLTSTKTGSVCVSMLKWNFQTHSCTSHLHHCAQKLLKDTWTPEELWVMFWMWMVSWISCLASDSLKIW